MPRDAHKLFPFVCSGYGVEFTGMHVIVDFVEIRCHHIDASGVSDEYDVVAELVGAEVDMECRAVIVDDKLGSWDYTWFVHIIVFEW